MINYPLMSRREALGLTLADVRTYLLEHGFNYSVEMLRAMERGERRLPVAPGFVVAMSQCLRMPVTNVWQTVHQTAISIRAHNAFVSKVQRLRPQNQILLRFILEHPAITEIPGFDFWFSVVKAIALRLPDYWFTRR